MNEKRSQRHLHLMATPARRLHLVTPRERAHATKRYRHLLSELDGLFDEFEHWLRIRDVVWFLAGICVMAVIAILLGQ